MAALPIILIFPLIGHHSVPSFPAPKPIQTMQPEPITKRYNSWSYSGPAKPCLRREGHKSLFPNAKHKPSRASPARLRQPSLDEIMSREARSTQNPCIPVRKASIEHSVSANGDLNCSEHCTRQVYACAPSALFESDSSSSKSSSQPHRCSKTSQHRNRELVNSSLHSVEEKKSRKTLVSKNNLSRSLHSHSKTKTTTVRNAELSCSLHSALTAKKKHVANKEKLSRSLYMTKDRHTHVPHKSSRISKHEPEKQASSKSLGKGAPGTQRSRPVKRDRHIHLSSHSTVNKPTSARNSTSKRKLTKKESSRRRIDSSAIKRCKIQVLQFLVDVGLLEKH